MTTEAEDLLNHIRGFVHANQAVPPGMVDTVTELVGRTVVLIMSRPDFYLHLKVVQDLQLQIQALQQQVRILQSAQRRATKAPAKKKAPSKKASSSNVRAFKRGAGGR